MKNFDFSPQTISAQSLSLSVNGIFSFPFLIFSDLEL